MTGNAAQTAKTGPRTREQPSSACADAEVPGCRAGSHIAPLGATETLRLIAHGRGCECGPCTAQEATK